MSSGVATFIRLFVIEEMRRRIAEAATGGEPLDLPNNAAEIALTYPGSELTKDDIAQQLFAEAARAGVRVHQSNDQRAVG